MSVLVTGGCGYIGSHLVWALVDAGQSVTVLDDLSTGFEWALPPQARLIRGDVGDAALLDWIMAGEKIDSIIHFAASMIVPQSISDPLSYYFNNTVKSRELIAAAVRNAVKAFVFSSTATVYGDPAETPLHEDLPLGPLSPYGWSKLMTETMLRDVAAAYDFHYAALRYFNVAGADPKGRTGQSGAGATHLIKVACETQLGLRPRITVFGTDYDTPDGTCLRDYIHVTDLADAHMVVLDRLRSGGASLVANCGYGRGVSVLDVLAAVERVGGMKLPIAFGPRRKGDARALVAKVDRIRAQLPAWRPKFDDLDAIVTHALAWERKLKAQRSRGETDDRQTALTAETFQQP